MYSQRIIAIKSEFEVVYQARQNILLLDGQEYTVHSQNMKELVILNTDSIDTVFCNQKYVLDIQYSDNPFSINTNGGLVKLHQKCDIP